MTGRLRLGDGATVSLERPLHGGGRRARWREQRLDELARLLRVEPDSILLHHRPLSGFARMSEEKTRESAPLQRCRLLEELLLGAADPRHEAVRFFVCRCGWHGKNVCRRGTHFKK
jgi:hypothetical protein